MSRSGRFTHRVDRYAEAVLDGGIVAGPYVRLACERHFRDRERAAGGGWFQFSEAFADQILDFYEGVLRLPDLVDELGDPQPFRLDVGSGFWAFVLGSGFGWVDKQRLRRFREWFIETGKGSAKALALDTPIPTVHGWKAMGDIVPGDVLFDERGQRTTVLGAYDVMYGHDCYRVTFDDGSSIVADAEHLWFTEKRNASDASDRGAALRGVKLRERGAWKKGIRTTAEIAATLRYRNGQYQSANHSIPVAGALDCLDVVLPIEPYTLGVWLGDGDSDCARVTVGTEDRDEMVGLLQATGTTCGTPKPTQTAWRVRVGGKGHPGPNIDSLNARLRLAGLFHNKHVPAAYLRASARQRLALLQGLMDTDGTIDKRNGQCSFTTTRRVLADGVRELGASLGMKAATRTSAAAIRGRRVGDAYHVAFFPPPGLMVFRLARKAAYQFQRHQRRRLSGDHRIVSCERVPSVPVRCIAVDSPSKLFLAGPSMVPTHNTPVLAGVGLYGLTSDGERAAEIYAAAADQDQAGIMFRDAVRIAKASPDLDEVLEYDGGSHIWQIRHPESLSFFKTFSRESGQKSGTRPHMGLLDELHEHPSHDTSVKVRAGAKRRPQPLFAEITNSGFDRTSICWQRHEHARRVVEQIVEDDRLLTYVCALDEGDDPMADEACWPKTNPYMGVTVTPEYLRRQVENAKNIPSEMNNVLRLNFCIWTQAHERFFDAAKWQAGAVMPTESELAGAPCYAGIDAGQSDDISAFARIWLLDDGRVAVKMRYWLPRAALEKYPERPYAQWEASGLLTVTDGDVVDYEAIEQTVEALCRESGVIQCGFDKRFLGQMSQRLAGVGLTMIDIAQGFHLNEAIKRVSEWVAGGELCHGGDPILSWMADNAVVKFGRNKEMRLDKEASKDKIDGIAALVIATRLVTLQEPEGPSVYESRGLLTV